MGRRFPEGGSIGVLRLGFQQLVQCHAYSMKGFGEVAWVEMFDAFNGHMFVFQKMVEVSLSELHLHPIITGKGEISQDANCSCEQKQRLCRCERSTCK